jgi:hypothetical protein
MARAISRGASPACVGPGSCGIASPARPRRALTAKPSDSSKRCCGSGPIGGPFSARLAAPRR